MNEPSLLDFIKAKIMPWKYSISEEYLVSTPMEEEEFSFNPVNEDLKQNDQVFIFTKLGEFKLLLA